MTPLSHAFWWPEQDVTAVDLRGWPVLYVLVTDTDDQALLHRELGRQEYCPVLLADFGHEQLWRFHHPDGPKPL